jgi:hypothetical protein
MKLAADRFLNLVQHYFMTHLDEDGREKFTEALERSERVDLSPEKRKVPSWWKGDTAAAESSILAAKQLGLTPVGG